MCSVQMSEQNKIISLYLLTYWSYNSDGVYTVKNERYLSIEISYFQSSKVYLSLVLFTSSICYILRCLGYIVVSCLVCIVVSCFVYIVLSCLVCIVVFTLDAELPASSQYSEGPATGHLDTGFSRFPCVYKQTLRRFPTFQVANTCFSCSPPDLNLLVTDFKFCIHVK